MRGNHTGYPLGFPFSSDHTLYCSVCPICCFVHQPCNFHKVVPANRHTFIWILWKILVYNCVWILELSPLHLSEADNFDHPMYFNTFLEFLQILTDPVVTAVSEKLQRSVSQILLKWAVQQSIGK
jgi:hypothetical protein